MPSPYAPDVWMHVRNGRPSTPHCVVGHGITQAAPDDEEEPRIERGH
jgi:hypothetical protein